MDVLLLCKLLSLFHLSPVQTPWPPGTECVAKYNFQGTTEQDLPFCKGDVLSIIGVTKVGVSTGMRETKKQIKQKKLTHRNKSTLPITQLHIIYICL